MSKEKKFLSQISTKIEKFDSESTTHKQMYRTYRYILFSLAAVTSILSGIALSFSELQISLNLLIVVVGAVSGIVTSIEGLRRPNELWIMERNVYYALLDLKEEYEYETEGGKNLDVDAYYRRMQLILNATKEKWTKMSHAGKIDSKSNKSGTSK